MGILDELRKAEAEAPPDVRDRVREATGTWHRICVCGHQERYHSERIGGTAPAREQDKTNTIHVTVGCHGEVWGRGRSMAEHSMEDKLPVVTKVATCPCLKFQPVAEALDPRFRFRQRRPTVKGSSARELNYLRHALMTGVRATETMVRKLKVVASAKVTDRQREELVEREMQRRFRWIEGARVCSVRNCDREGDDVWPIYVTGDQSELKCGLHR